MPDGGGTSGMEFDGEGFLVVAEQGSMLQRVFETEEVRARSRMVSQSVEDRLWSAGSIWGRNEARS